MTELDSATSALVKLSITFWRSFSQIGTRHFTAQRKRL
jgi:hypothetical protein